VDWLTLTRDEVENDALVPVCVHCGRPATGRHNQTFEWHPHWAVLLLFAGLVPGVVAMLLTRQQMRVSLPVCARHGPMPPGRIFAWSGGWLAGPALGTLALMFDFSIWIFLIGLGIGLAGWLIVMVLTRTPGYRSFEVKSIGADGLSLVGLDDTFVKAMKEQRLSTIAPRPSPSPPSTDIVRELP